MLHPPRIAGVWSEDARTRRSWGASWRTVWERTKPPNHLIVWRERWGASAQRPNMSATARQAVTASTLKTGCGQSLRAHDRLATPVAFSNDAGLPCRGVG